MTSVGSSDSPVRAIRQRSGVELALLDTDGVVIAVNDAWLAFSSANGGDSSRSGVGVSYLGVCDAAGDAVSAEVAAAIRSALAGDLPAPMNVTVPCDSPTVRRDFDVLVSSRFDDGGHCVGATVTLSEVAAGPVVSPTTDAGPTSPAAVRAQASAQGWSIGATRVAERERIALYLNDRVVSELFAIGLRLQGLSGVVQGPGQRAQLAATAEAIDAVIRDIRGTVFDVAPVPESRSRVKPRLIEVIDDARGSRPLRTDVVFSGQLDSELTSDEQHLVVDVVRDIVGYAVRGRGASAVQIRVALTGRRVEVEVVQDGSRTEGLPTTDDLGQLRSSAQARGGDFQVAPTATGQLLSWTSDLGSLATAAS